MKRAEQPDDRRTARVNRISSLILVLALAIAGYVAYQARPWESSPDAPTALGLVDADPDAPRPGNLAPDFTLARADGTLLRLSDLRGQPVFLNFWATWCTFCKEEMPDMQLISDQFDGQLVVLGINAGDGITQGDSFARSIGATYELVYDTDMQVTEGYGVRAMPTSYFIGPDGTIVDAHFGFLSHADMLEKVDELTTVAGT